MALVFLAFVLVGAWLPTRLMVATTDSLEHRVFFLGGKTTKNALGDYLVFRLEDLSRAQQGGEAGKNRLVKQVGCYEGQTLRVDAARNFFCDGRLLGQALEFDSRGEPLPLFIPDGPVPLGKLFMIGSHPRSYDSKYFGYVDADEILFKAYPLW